MKKYLLVIVFLPAFLWSQHKVEGTFTPAEEFTYAFLYHATPTGSDYVDRAQLEADGSFNIAFDSTAAHGIYKIVYALPPEDNNFDFIYNGEEDVAFNFSLDQGLDFTASNENKLWSSYTKSMELVNMTISNFYTKESTDEVAFKEIFKTLKDTQNAFEEASNGTMANVFIKANRPYVPDTFEDVSTYSKHLKKTYLDHVDFSHPLLQSSDFLIDRVLAYVFGISQNTDNEAYKKDVDNLVSKIGGDQIQIKTMLLELIWSRFTQQDNETVANYITDAYLLELAQQIEYPELIDALRVYKNNAIGNIAYNFDLATTTNGKTETTTLHGLEGFEQYLVVFWSSTCGHCLEELPQVKELLASNPQLKVIAFGLEDDAENWQKEIMNFPDFIHVLGLQKWENTVAHEYGVKSTPSYFLLDKNKAIMAKPYDVDVLTKLFE